MAPDEPVLPELEPAPLVLGLVVAPLAPLEEPLLLGEELLGEVVLDELPPVAPLAPELEPDLLKYASHSVFETWPSLLVSTVVKLGAAPEAPAEPDIPELPPLAALPPDEDVSPEVLGVDGVALGVELEAPLLGEVVDEELPEAPVEPLAPDVLLPVALGVDEEPAEPELV